MSDVRPPGTPRSPRRTALRVAQTVLVVATAYFLGAYLVRYWPSISAYDWAFRPGWLILSAAFFFLYYLSHGTAWWLLLRGFGVSSPYLTANATWGKSILARYIPGNVFMFVGRGWMSHGQGLPIDRVSAAMVYEQALGVCGALAVVAVLFPFWEYRPGFTALSLIALPVIIVGLHPRVFGPASARLLRVLHRPPLDATLGFGTMMAMLGFFAASWVVGGAGAWLLGRAVTDMDVSALPLVVIALALSYVVGMVLFIFPSGIGVREAVITASLRDALPGGVALAWALLLRLWMVALELLFVGLIVLVEAAVRRRGPRA